MSQLHPEGSRRPISPGPVPHHQVGEPGSPMLRSMKDLEGYTVSASDGDIGRVGNFLLDDKRWTVRYLVVATGGLWDGRQVLISPISFRRAEWAGQRFHLALTKDKIRHSPSIDTDKPVSRQHERDYYRYYRYPYYWGYAGIWGAGSYPGMLVDGDWTESRDPEPEQATRDSHLRSVKEVRGYHIQGRDGGIGHVEDFIVDDATWQIRYLVINTSNWGLGKKVLVSPDWIDRVSWAQRKVFVDLSRQGIRTSPEWNSDAGVNREYEVRLYDYHGRPAYWAGRNP